MFTVFDPEMARTLGLRTKLLVAASCSSPSPSPSRCRRAPSAPCRCSPSWSSRRRRRCCSASRMWSVFAISVGIGVVSAFARLLGVVPLVAADGRVDGDRRRRVFLLLALIGALSTPGETMTRRSRSRSHRLLAGATAHAQVDGGAPPNDPRAADGGVLRGRDREGAAGRRRRAEGRRKATGRAVGADAATAGAVDAARGFGAAMGRVFQSLNPDISAIVDFAAGWYADDQGTIKSGDDPQSTGFKVQEVELALQAVVDPYFRADIFLTIPNLAGIEVEEAFLTTTHLPAQLADQGGHLPRRHRAAERAASAPAGLHAPPRAQRAVPRHRRAARARPRGQLAGAAPALLPGARRLDVLGGAGRARSDAADVRRRRALGLHLRGDGARLLPASATRPRCTRG